MNSSVTLAMNLIALVGCAVIAWTTMAPLVRPETRKRPAAPVESLAVPIYLPLKPGEFSDQSVGRIAIVEFSDLHCRYSARFALDTLPQLLDYGPEGRHLEHFTRHLPIERIHPGARKSAGGVECARTLGKMGDLRRALFTRVSAGAEVDLIGQATEVGIDPAWFAGCLMTRDWRTIDQDREEAKRVDVLVTPTVIVGLVQKDARVMGVTRINGAQDLEVFRREIAAIATAAAAM